MQSPSSPERIVAASPGGVLDCLALDGNVLQRRVFVSMLGAGGFLQLHVPSLASALHVGSQAVAQALFALMRQGCIVVADQAREIATTDWRQRGLAGLHADLMALTNPGQKIVLATQDGLCVAHTGWSTYEAEIIACRGAQDWAAAGGEVWPLQLGARRFRLCTHAPIDRRNTALLGLGYRMLDLFGEIDAKEMSCKSP